MVLTHTMRYLLLCILISLLTFTVQTINSSYWESYSSENSAGNQDSFIWLMIFIILMPCLLDNVLALWWELRSSSLLEYKGVFKQTSRKDDFNTVYYMAWLTLRAGKMTKILRSDWLPERARWYYFLKDSEGRLAWRSRALNQFFADHYFLLSNGWKMSII